MKFKVRLGTDPRLAPIRLSKCLAYSEFESGRHAINWRSYRKDPRNQPRKIHRFNVLANKPLAYATRCCSAFEFQTEGIEFLRSSTSGFAIIGDQMGMGKTIQLLTATRKILAQQGGIAIVFCPVSVAPSWVDAVYENVKIPLDIELTSQEELRENRIRNALQQVQKKSDQDGIGGFRDVPVGSYYKDRYEALNPLKPGSDTERYHISNMTCDLNLDMNKDRFYVADNVNVVYFSKADQAEAHLRDIMGIMSREDEAAAISSRSYPTYEAFEQIEDSLTNTTPGAISDYEPNAKGMMNLKIRKRTVIVMPYSQVGSFLVRSGGQTSAVDKKSKTAQRYSAILPRLVRLLRVVIADEADEIRNMTDCSIGKSRMSRLLIYRMRQAEYLDQETAADPKYQARFKEIQQRIDRLLAQLKLINREILATRRNKQKQDFAKAKKKDAMRSLKIERMALENARHHTLDVPDPRFVFMATGTPVNNRLTDIQRVLRVGMRADLSRGIDRDPKQIKLLTKISMMDTFSRDGRLDLVMEILEEAVFPYIIARNFNMDVGRGLSAGRSTIYLEPSIVTVYAVPNTVAMNRQMRVLISQFQKKADRLQVAINNAQRSQRNVKQPFHFANVQQAFESVNTTLAKMLTTSFMPPLADFTNDADNAGSIGSLLEDVNPPDAVISNLAQFRQYPMLFEAVDLAFRLVLRNLLRGPPYRKLVIACASVEPFKYISKYLMEALNLYQAAVKNRLEEHDIDPDEAKALRTINAKIKDFDFADTKEVGEVASSKRKRKGKSDPAASDMPFLVKLVGMTRSADRQRMIVEFRDPMKNPHVMLLSVKAGGQGITLTQATDMIIMGLPENVKYWLQVVARIRRISQNVTTRLHLFVTTNKDAYTAEFELGEVYTRGSKDAGGMDEPWKTQALKRAPSTQLTNPLHHGLALLKEAYIKVFGNRLAIPYADGDGYCDGYPEGTLIQQSFTAFDRGQDAAARSRARVNQVQEAHDDAIAALQAEALAAGSAGVEAAKGIVPYGAVRQDRVVDEARLVIDIADESGMLSGMPDMLPEIDREAEYRTENYRYIIAKQKQSARKRYEKSGVMLDKTSTGKVRGESFTEFLLRLSESKSFLNDMMRGLISPGFVPPDMVTLLRFRNTMAAYMDDEDMARTVVLMGYFQRSPVNPLNFPDNVGELATGIDALAYRLMETTTPFYQAVFTIFCKSIERTQKAREDGNANVLIGGAEYDVQRQFTGIPNAAALDEKLDKNPAYGAMGDDEDSMTRKLQWRELFKTFKQLEEIKRRRMGEREKQIMLLLTVNPFDCKDAHTRAEWKEAAREVNVDDANLLGQPDARARVIEYLQSLDLEEREEMRKRAEAEYRSIQDSGRPGEELRKAMNLKIAERTITNMKKVLAEEADPDAIRQFREQEKRSGTKKRHDQMLTDRDVFGEMRARYNVDRVIRASRMSDPTQREAEGEGDGAGAGTDTPAPSSSPMDVPTAVDIGDPDATM